MFAPHNSISSSALAGRFCTPSLQSIFSRLMSKLFILVVFASAIGCQTKTVQFDSFESKLWKSDTSECFDYRNSVINAMKAEFDQFIGMSETELITHLGNPNKTLLYTRGQKFYSYSLACNKSEEISKSLRIRFSALNYVNEVLVLD